MKRLKIILIFAIMMVSASICLFAGFNSSPVYAEISGVSGNNYVLTGYVGYQPVDYFDSLSSSEIETPSKNYYNQSGVSSKKYYAIAPDVSLFRKNYNTGFATIYLTDEMKALASHGFLSAKASAGLLAFNERQSSKVKITITVYYEDGSSAQKDISSSRVYDDGAVYNPEWVSTDYIELMNATSIKFSFTSLDKSNLFNSANFLIFEPSISIKSTIDSLIFENLSKDVYPNEVIELRGYNDITTMTEGGDLINYYKSYHKVSYEIVAGASYVDAFGSYLNVRSSAPDNAEIVVRAKCKANSTSNDYLYSGNITYTVCKNKVQILPVVDFEQYGVIGGGGSYYVGQTVSLSVSLNGGYNFINWTINDNVITEQNARFVVQRTNNVKLNLTKDLYISQIVVADKVYDGPTMLELFNMFWKVKRLEMI